MRSRLWLAGLAAGILAISGAARADGLPASVTATLMLKVLTYDRSLSERVSGAPTVVVLYRPGHSQSEATRSELQQALEVAAGRSNLSGGRPRLVKVAYTEPGKLEEELGGEKAAALFVCPGLEEAVDAIAKVTRRRHVLTFSGSRAAVESGLSIGLLRKGEKPLLMVNLQAARAEGAELDSAFLRLAEVINESSRQTP